MLRISHNNPESPNRWVIQEERAQRVVMWRTHHRALPLPFDSGSFAAAGPVQPQPATALLVFAQSNRDVATAVALNDGAVRVPALPASGLAIDLGVGVDPIESFDEVGF